MTPLSPSSSRPLAARRPADSRRLPRALAATLAAALLVLLALPASAQPRGEGPPPPPGAEPPPHGERPPPELRQRVRERITRARNETLTRELQLDEPTAGELFAILDRFHAREVTARQELRRARRALREALAQTPPVADDALARRVDQLLERQRALDAVRLELFEATARVLSTRQQAQLLVALPAFERKVRRIIRKVRRRHRRGRHRGRPDRPGRRRRPGRRPGRRGRPDRPGQPPR